MVFYREELSCSVLELTVCLQSKLQSISLDSTSVHHLHSRTKHMWSILSAELAQRVSVYVAQSRVRNKMFFFSLALKDTRSPDLLNPNLWDEPDCRL